jgi:hypothetical protein
MLKIVEYGLLAVSLLVVLGLILSGSRGHSDSGSQSDHSDAQEPGKAH